MMIPYIDRPASAQPQSEPKSLGVGGASLRGLHGQVVERVGSAIGSGDIPVGAQLVPEMIAAETASSRAVVREALRVLESKGLVVARPRIGTRVRQVGDWDLLDPDVIRWRSTGTESAKQLQELLDIRGAIEPLAARHAARSTSERHIQQLRDAVGAMGVAVASSDWDGFTEADVTFHRELLAAGGNRIVSQLADPIEAALRVRHSLKLIPHELSDGVVASHRAIIDAIEAGDPVRSELASRRIVDVAGAEVISALLARD